jgi:hypothetical protein
MTAAPPIRTIYDDLDQPWPVQPEQMVRIIGTYGRPVEGSRARCVRAGETVEADLGNVTVRGVML